MTTPQFLLVLGRSSVEAGALTLLVLAAQRIFRRQLAPRWRCALWLLVAARLLIPVSVNSVTSLFNLAPSWAQPARVMPASPPPTPLAVVPAPTAMPPAPASANPPAQPSDNITTYSKAPAKAITPGAVTQPATVTAPIPPNTPISPITPTPATTSAVPATALGPIALNWPQLLLGFWLAGTVVIASYLLFSSIGLARRFRHGQRLRDPQIEAQLLAAGRQLGLAAAPLPVYECDRLRSPALYGCWRPRLLLPAGFTTRFSSAELGYVFLHELAHVRRRDLPLNWLWALLQVAHWFNPLVWFASYRWRADRELACDAMVLEAAGPAHNEAYGRTILHILESFTSPTLAPGLVGIIEDQRLLRERICQIAAFAPRRQWPLLTATLMAGLALVGLTDAQVAAPPVSPTPPQIPITAATAPTPPSSPFPAPPPPPDPTPIASQLPYPGTTPAVLEPNPDPTAQGHLDQAQHDLAIAQADLEAGQKVRVLQGRYGVFLDQARAHVIKALAAVNDASAYVKAHPEVNPLKIRLAIEGTPKILSFAIPPNSSRVPGETLIATIDGLNKALAQLVNNPNIQSPAPVMDELGGLRKSIMDEINLAASDVLTAIRVDAEAPGGRGRDALAAALGRLAGVGVGATSNPTPNLAPTAQAHLEATQRALDAAQAGLNATEANFGGFMEKAFARVTQAQADVTEALAYVKAHPETNPLPVGPVSAAAAAADPVQSLQYVTIPAKPASSFPWMWRAWTALNTALSDLANNSASDYRGPIVGDLGGYRAKIIADIGLARADVVSGINLALAGSAPLEQQRAETRLTALADLRSHLAANLGIKLVAIPAGTFLMGSPADEAGHYQDEGPQTRVTLTKDFFLGATDVSQGQYEAVMGTNPNSSKNAGQDAPVAGLSWDDAMAFCQKLTDRECAAGVLPYDYAFTLPTEAQWEYACRAETARPDAGKLDAMAGASNNSGGTTHPVGQNQPNAWGLYDMTGNVWQWCLDWYGPYPGGSVTDPAGWPTGFARIVRGGSSSLGRFAFRSFYSPSLHDGFGGTIGFRIALVKLTAAQIAAYAAQSATEQIPATAPTPSAAAGTSPTVSPPVTPATPASLLVQQEQKQAEVRLAALSGLRSHLSADVGIKLVAIPAGTFMMGSPSDEASPNSNAAPQTRVTLTNDFLLGATDVTQGQYEAIMGNNPSYFKTVGQDAPVELVEWNNATAFCEKLTERECAAGLLPEDYAFVLPTEAQWEYACRAETTGPYAGDLDAMAWYNKNSGNTTHPVGQKQPNAWGLYDMYGDVAQWCGDSPLTYPGGAVTDPVGPVPETIRPQFIGEVMDPARRWSQIYGHVVRGGSYQEAPWGSASRRFIPGYHGRWIGFRIALVHLTDAQIVAYTAHQDQKQAQARLAALASLRSHLAADVGIKLVAIPAGTFMMGSPSDETGHLRNEGPQTRVTLTKDFFLGASDVTQGQYEALMGTNPSHFKDAGSDAPVEQISWNDAMAFCQKLTDRECAAGALPNDYAFTLPTEAQWEYAGRAGTTGPYAGDLDAMAWNVNNSGGMTHPVGTKQPNAWGLYDMTGNVWQWCLDWYGDFPGGAVTDPSGSASGRDRVYRGGSWSNVTAQGRSAYRGRGAPGLPLFDGIIGFRIALVHLTDAQIAAYAAQSAAAAQTSAAPIPSTTPAPANSQNPSANSLQ